MRTIYVGKCEDGAFYHVIVTKFNVHVYRRYHNGRRWVTTRILAGIENIVKNLRTLPGRVRTVLREVLAKLRIYTTVLDEASRNVLRLTINVLDMCRKALPYLDFVPEKIRRKAWTIIEEEADKIMRQAQHIAIPERVRRRVLNAETVLDLLSAIQLSLMELVES